MKVPVHVRQMLSGKPDYLQGGCGLNGRRQQGLGEARVPGRGYGTQQKQKPCG